jgi:putative endonuclease
MHTRWERGRASEELAAEYLTARGVLILARNLRCRAGELDLIGLDGEVLAVIEVRMRRAARFGGAPASVTRRKQLRIIRAAGFFLQRRIEWRSRVMRFDVFAVEGLPDHSHHVLWLKDAFRAT